MRSKPPGSIRTLDTDKVRARRLQEEKEMEEDRTSGHERTVRHAYTSTSGGNVFVEDREVVNVSAVTTQKCGPCLVLRMRDGEKLWIIDSARSRRQLRLGAPADEVEAKAILRTRNIWKTTDDDVAGKADPKKKAGESSSDDPPWKP
jgi:hypothetical protein